MSDRDVPQPRQGEVTTWKRRRLGPSYAVCVQRRQVRVGRSPEPVVVVRLGEDVKAGDEIVLTRRTLRFCAFGMDYEERRR